MRAIQALRDHQTGPAGSGLNGTGPERAGRRPARRAGQGQAGGGLRRPPGHRHVQCSGGGGRGLARAAVKPLPRPPWPLPSHPPPLPLCGAFAGHGLLVCLPITGIILPKMRRERRRKSMSRPRRRRAWARRRAGATGRAGAGASPLVQLVCCHVLACCLPPTLHLLLPSSQHRLLNRQSCYRSRTAAWAPSCPPSHPPPSASCGCSSWSASRCGLLLHTPVYIQMRLAQAASPGHFVRLPAAGCHGMHLQGWPLMEGTFVHTLALAPLSSTLSLPNGCRTGC